MPDVDDSIRKGLDGSSSDDSAKYIDWLRSTATEYSQQTRRIVILILILMAAFGLVAESFGTSLSIGNFRIYKGSVVHQFIPAVIALCFLQVIFDTRQLILHRMALRAAVRHWNRSAADNGLDALIQPSSLLYWNVTSSFHPAFMRRGEFNFAFIISNALFVVLILGELAFQVLAYLKLFDLAKTNNVPLIISAVVAAASTIVAFGYLLRLNAQSALRRRPRRHHDRGGSNPQPSDP